MVALADQRTRLLADVMLGSLARWLRVLGYDTYYDNCIGDDEIIQRSRLENRIVLTKDRDLLKRKALESSFYVTGSTLAEQLVQVLSYLGDTAQPRSILSRCIECNRLLEPVTPAEVKDAVPPYVYQTEKRFSRCPGCGKIFWPGTHRVHIIDRLNSLLKQEFPICQSENRAE